MIPQLLGLFGGGGGAGPGVGLPSGLIPSGGMMASGGLARGGLTLVGEEGPEIVDMNAGARVYSNADSKKMFGGGSVTVNQHFNVQGQVDPRTARQMAREAAGAVNAVRARG
jgi:hypothetical protein